MNNFDKVYKNYDPSTKKLASLNSKQIEQIDLLVDYIRRHLPSYETKQEQKAIFETLIEEIEDVMSIYQDGW